MIPCTPAFLEAARAEWGPCIPEWIFHFLPEAFPVTGFQAPAANSEQSSRVRALEHEKDEQSTTNKKRKVELQKYISRRAELLEANKPVYNYKPTIIQEYTKDDFYQHNALFHSAHKSAVLIRIYNLGAPAAIINRMSQCQDMMSHQSHENAFMYFTITGKEQGQMKKRAARYQPDVFKEHQITVSEVNISVLKSHIQPAHRSDRWYLVIDTKVLLEDMYFIEKLLKSDNECCMHLPYEVLHDLTAMTHKRCKAWMRMPARRAAQFLETLLKYGKGQGAVEAEDVLNSPVAYDSVINCCLQLMRLYYYVVLISNCPKRKERADSIDLPCYTLPEVKQRTSSEKITVKVSNLFISNTPKMQLALPVMQSALPDMWSALPGMHSALPDMQSALPGMQSALPGMQSALPGMQSALPGMQSATRGMQSTLPDMQSALPGMQSALPGMQSTTRGMQSTLPDMQSALPGMQSALPGMQSATGGMQSALPGTQSALPGMQSALPGMQSATRHMQSALPGMQSALPGMQSALPGMQSATRGMQSALPGMQSALPGMQAALPGMQSATRGMQSALPGMQSVLPGMHYQKNTRRFQVCSSNKDTPLAPNLK